MKVAELDRTEANAEAPAGAADALPGAVRTLRQRAGVTFDSVAGLAEAKRAIGLAVGLAIARPPPGVVLSPVWRILFCGPPGTRKTLMAAATSNAVRRRDGSPAAFYAAKVSELLSPTFGGSARIVTALYAAAKQDAPAVAFLNEFEALGMSRDSAAGKGAEERRILSTLLAELDGLADKGTDAPFVLTIAATNSGLVDKESTQVLRMFADRRVTALRVFLKTLQGDRLQVARDIPPDAARQRRVRLDNVDQGLGRVTAEDGRPPEKHMVLEFGSRVFSSRGVSRFQ